jgi:hypothetical protein
MGLKGSQITELERDFKDLVDLRFYTSDKSKASLRPMIAGADFVLAFRMIGHPHQEIVKSKIRDINNFKVLDGLTDFRDTLNNILIGKGIIPYAVKMGHAPSNNIRAD